MRVGGRSGGWAEDEPAVLAVAVVKTDDGLGAASVYVILQAEGLFVSAHFK